MTAMEEQAHEDFADSSSWASMDPELKEAACCGDVDFLKSAIAPSKPPAYFLSRFTPSSSSSDNNDDDDADVRYAGNILHLAIWQGRVEFVAVAMSMLPEKIINLLISQQETSGGQHWNPLHVAVWNANSSIVELIANCCIGEVFVAQDSQGRTPALLAIETGKSECASILTTGSLAELIKNVGDHEGGMPLYWAVCNGLYDVILNLLECEGTLCCTGPDGLTALHVMTELASAPQEQLIEKVLRKFPSLITQPDSRGVTPLDKASADGMESLVQLMLRIDPSSLRSSPSAWIKACENGHVSVILVFIKHYPNFRGFCRGRRTTALHHIKLGSYEEYKEFLVIDKLIEEQKNNQDMDGATPLHTAIAREDMDLTEALLTDGADRTIKDKDDKTAVDLLAEVCKDNDEWYAMCKRVGIDPRLTTTYVQRETNLLEMRGALSVVAGLLATITFTAGFTLPGGLNNDTGEALLAKHAAFLVFLLADTYAMCCSMLVLFCLIWSMLSDGDKSLIFMDRSVFLLLQSLHATLVAFMTGVFIVIFHKSLWTAIVVIVICFYTGVFASGRSILLRLINELVPFTYIEVPLTDTENGYLNRFLKALVSCAVNTSIFKLE